MFGLYNKSNFKKLESGRSFSLKTTLNKIIHYGVYHEDLDLVTITFYVVSKNEYISVHFSLKEAKQKIKSGEWTIL